MRKKRGRSFIAGCGGATAGLLLWFAVRKPVGEGMSWWMGLLLLLGCVSVGVFLESLDARKVKPDIVFRKHDVESEDAKTKKR